MFESNRAHMPTLLFHDFYVLLFLAYIPFLRKIYYKFNSEKEILKMMDCLYLSTDRYVRLCAGPKTKISEIVFSLPTSQESNLIIIFRTQNPVKFKQGNYCLKGGRFKR